MADRVGSGTQVETIRDLGVVVRQARLAAGLAQGELARSVGVSRQWLSALETGKPAVDLGLVLRVLDRLGLGLEVGRAAAGVARSPSTVTPGVDLDDLLDAYRRPS